MNVKENRLVKYLIDSKTELKKVTWPTKKNITKYSLIVIGMSLGIALFLGALDLLFSESISLLIK